MKLSWKIFFLTCFDLIVWKRIKFDISLPVAILPMLQILPRGGMGDLNLAVGQTSLFFRDSLQVASEPGETRMWERRRTKRQDWRWGGFCPSSGGRKAQKRLLLRIYFTQKPHDYFAQELEKIEAELTSLGKLKSETQGWQKKVKPLSLLCKFLFTFGSFFSSFKKSGVFIH